MTITSLSSDPASVRHAHQVLARLAAAPAGERLHVYDLQPDEIAATLRAIADRATEGVVVQHGYRRVNAPGGVVLTFA